MHFPFGSRSDTAVLLTLLLAPLHASAALRCEHIRVDDTDFNLGKLGGPHTVVTSRWTPPTYTNTTYTLDICKPLKRKGDVPKGHECPNNTRVCAIQRLFKPEDGHTDIHEVIPIAGELKDHGGGALDAKAERLKTSDSQGDNDKEGVRLILNGGRYPMFSKKERSQKTVIEFICDRDKTGLEDEWAATEEYEKSSLSAREDKEKEGDGEDQPSGEETQLINEGAPLIFNSYGPAEKGNMDVLRLTWRTKYACEDAWKKPDNDGDGDETSPSSGWGFFTWFILIAFLGIAAYLIFGSWLNYNRYGARGWDLLPHGDTIRDIPYILKDLARSLLNSVQGSGTRGGYSAL